MGATLDSSSSRIIRLRSTSCRSRRSKWLLTCRNLAALEWIFVGRWLFLDKPDDAKVLGDRAKLARIADETFRALYPLWLSAYAG